MSKLTTSQDEINPDVTNVELNGEIVGDILDEHGVISSRGRYAARSSKAPGNGLLGFFATTDEALAAIRALVPPGAEPAATHIVGSNGGKTHLAADGTGCRNEHGGWVQLTPNCRSMASTSSNTTTYRDTTNPVDCISCAQVVAYRAAKLAA